MRVLAVFAVVAALVAPAHAAVDHPGPGSVCQFVATTDPTADPNTSAGQLSGGPLVLDDTATGLPGSGTLTCRIQVGTADHTGFGPQVQGHGTGVVTAGPAEIAYRSSPGAVVYLCAELTDDSDGRTYYYDGNGPIWSTDSRRPCEPVDGTTLGDCTPDSGCARVTTGPVYRTVTVRDVDFGPLADVVGRVDIERFALPTGGSATLPCVVFVVNGAPTDPCRAAGGAYVSTLVYLLDGPVPEPVAAGSLAAQKVCTATVTLTVFGIGVEDFPAYMLC